jgi:hypothetical protein
VFFLDKFGKPTGLDERVQKKSNGEGEGEQRADGQMRAQYVSPAIFGSPTSAYYYITHFERRTGF